jgi:peptidyl-prolyl cis-trans isomerase C
MPRDFMSRHVLLAALLAVFVAPAIAADAAPAAAPVAAPAAPAADKLLATVNGVSLPKVFGDLMKSQAQRNGQQVSDEQVRDEAVRLEVLAQEATKQGLDKNPTLNAQLELQKKAGLARLLVQSYARQNVPAEAAVKAEYERIKLAAPARLEYLSRHILVASEKEAKEILAKLEDKKNKFEDLAKKSSKDTGSAKKGGELGWSPAEAYVPEFAQALAKLKKGETTKEAVKSKFGFHIIRLEDVRQQEFPAYDKVKDEVVQNMQQKAVDDYIAKLRAVAKVE